MLCGLIINFWYGVLGVEELCIRQVSHDIATSFEWDGEKSGRWILMGQVKQTPRTVFAPL